MDVTDVDTLTQRIKNKEREKMSQCQQVKKKKEYEELKECTFTPAIKRVVPKQPAGPIVVRGLGRHLELKELAQRQAQDKAERQRKAFLTNVGSSAKGSYTVPAPFSLSSNDRKHQVSAPFSATVDACFLGNSISTPGPRTHRFVLSTLRPSPTPTLSPKDNAQYTCQ